MGVLKGSAPMMPTNLAKDFNSRDHQFRICLKRKDRSANEYDNNICRSKLLSLDLCLHNGNGKAVFCRYT